MAEHSYWVAMYAYIICNMEYDEHATSVPPVSDCVYAALFHDWEEAVTGDLPSLVKRTCKSSWTQVEEAGFEQIIGLIHPGNPVSIDAYNFWRPNPEVKKIVKAADLLDRLIYGWEEKLRGSQAFDEIMDETVKQLRDLGLKCIPHLLSILGFTGEGRELPESMTHL